MVFVSSCHQIQHSMPFATRDQDADQSGNDATRHASDASTVKMEPTADRALVTQQRAAFMKLLRSGVREKLENQPPTEEVGSWQALAWRNAYALDPFFLETVCGKPLRIKQLLQGELTGFGTGLTVWPAACLLLKHLEYRYAIHGKSCDLEGKLVVELGSGTGAVGIAMAMLGAGRVVVTDVQKVLFLMETNAQLAQEQCGGHLQIDVEPYDWGAPPGPRLLTDEGRLPDIVLISDCILPRLYPIEPLVAALGCLCGPHTTVIISYEARHFPLYDPKVKFWTLLQQSGFSIRTIDADMYHPHYRADDIEVWEARRV